METQTSSTVVVSVRVSSDERALLETASQQARTSLSDFIRRKALEAAETDVLGRAIVTIPAQDWQAFESWLAAPPRNVPGLADLAKRKASWEK